MFSYLFAKPTMLVDMDTRAAAIAHDRPVSRAKMLMSNHRRAAGNRPSRAFRDPAAVPDPLQQAKVFLLVSKRTGSAGEHLALR